MKHILAATAVALTGWTCVIAAQAQSAPGAGTAPAISGLSDLDAITFGCPKAALNAAARRAASVPSQGTYQFSYFNIVSDSHHAMYEVRFKSNYEGEAELKYCVEIYCQQGWDPATTKASVTLMSNRRQPAGAAAHGDACRAMQMPVNRRVK
ncbi:MAG TPA: hypothetical protein VI485_13635 [Vicinamibacterales bacterium]|nr:hypothetical protein [Vicinamibacterales bacterium]